MVSIELKSVKKGEIARSRSLWAQKIDDKKIISTEEKIVDELVEIPNILKKQHGIAY